MPRGPALDSNLSLLRAPDVAAGQRSNGRRVLEPARVERTRVLDLTTPAERVVVLRLRFAAYESLVSELGDHAGARVAYNGESIELMSPSADHERYNRLLEGLVRLFALERQIDIESLGSVTLKREPHGAEPDSCFYVQNFERVVGKKQLDLGVDPPPDIVVEIDISRERIDKTLIYEALRVPEFWRYDGRELRAFALRSESYVEIKVSERLAGIPIAELDRFLEMRKGHGHSEILRAWQAWLRD